MAALPHNLPSEMPPGMPPPPSPTNAPLDPALVRAVLESVPPPGCPLSAIDPANKLHTLAEYLRCAADPVYFIYRYVRIRHAQRGNIPFALWPWQADLLDCWRHERLSIVLKARQLGVSELAQAYALWLIRFYDAKSVLIISKNEDAATKLLERTKFAYAHLPRWLQATDDGVDHAFLGKLNSTTFQFEHYDSDGHSSPSWITSLPATISAGRSESASLVILDEWAHQQFDRQIWTAVSPTIATGGTLIGMSTANGAGDNVFYRIWSAAERRENAFFPVFISWRAHPERDETWYAQESANHEPSEMRQEFPSTPAEAFIQSGNPVFDMTVLLAARERITAEATSARTATDPASSAPTPIPFPLEQHDGLTVWEPPLPGHTYVVGADVASGAPDGDYSAACVIDRATLHQVAELHGRWPSEVFAELLWDLGLRYNTALLAVEDAQEGSAVLLRLAQPARAHEAINGAGEWVRCGPTTSYPRIYHRTDALTPGQHPLRRPGWNTNAHSKPLALTALKRVLREGVYHVRSLLFISEALVYSYQDKMGGPSGAPAGEHDDVVMAHAICVYLATLPDEHAHAFAYLARMQELVAGRQLETHLLASTAGGVLPTTPLLAGPVGPQGDASAGATPGVATAGVALSALGAYLGNGAGAATPAAGGGTPGVAARPTGPSTQQLLAQIRQMRALRRY